MVQFIFQFPPFLTGNFHLDFSSLENASPCGNHDKCSDETRVLQYMYITIIKPELSALNIANVTIHLHGMLEGTYLAIPFVVTFHCNKLFIRFPLLRILLCGVYTTCVLKFHSVTHSHHLSFRFLSCTFILLQNRVTKLFYVLWI